MSSSLSEAKVRAAFPARPISFFETITSTMHEATALAAAGCPS
jgi:hypothetical protein